MTGLPLDTVQKYDELPEYGTAVTMVGDPETLWEDGSDETYTDHSGTGFGAAWGQPYARVPGLTMSASDAAQVTEIVVRMRVRVREGPPPDGPILLPYIVTDPNVIGGDGLTLTPRDFTNAGDYTRLQLFNADWMWVDVPMVALDNNRNIVPVQPYLTNPADKFVLFYIDSAWADQHFQIAEVEILTGVVLVEPPTYRRIFPRDDSLAGGAGRNFPRPRSVQSSNRIGGGYF